MAGRRGNSVHSKDTALATPAGGGAEPARCLPRDPLYVPLRSVGAGRQATEEANSGEDPQLAMVRTKGNWICFEGLLRDDSKRQGACIALP